MNCQKSNNLLNVFMKSEKDFFPSLFLIFRGENGIVFITLLARVVLLARGYYIITKCAANIFCF